jgi:CheY-like chemotaxis protein
VDDEPDILDAVGDLLEHELPGVVVLRANSGREGLGMLQSERVDGIIADFNMPDMDGLQFLCIARQCHPSIPRVMMTATPDPDLVDLARQDAAVQDFLPKLMAPDEFVGRLTGLLSYTPSIRPAP